MRSRKIPISAPGKDVRLQPKDFSTVLAAIPEDCVLIGGQAVAWWAERFGIKAIVDGREQEVTSRDIDFWQPGRFTPNSVGIKTNPGTAGSPCNDNSRWRSRSQSWREKTALEMLHTVPGLDSINPSSVAVLENVSSEDRKRKLLVLSPVSLVLTKLHGLRHFPQDDRQDLLHLKVSLSASKAFITELLRESARMALWNCNRRIEAHRQRPNRILEQFHNFEILSGVPIEQIQSEGRKVKSDDRDKLRRFVNIQWPRVTA